MKAYAPVWEENLVALFSHSYGHSVQGNTAPSWGSVNTIAFTCKPVKTVFPGPHELPSWTQQSGSNMRMVAHPRMTCCLRGGALTLWKEETLCSWVSDWKEMSASGKSSSCVTRGLLPPLRASVSGKSFTSLNLSFPPVKWEPKVYSLVWFK